MRAGTGSRSRLSSDNLCAIRWMILDGGFAYAAETLAVLREDDHRLSMISRSQTSTYSGTPKTSLYKIQAEWDAGSH